MVPFNPISYSAALIAASASLSAWESDEPETLEELLEHHRSIVRRRNEKARKKKIFGRRAPRKTNRSFS